MSKVVGITSDIKELICAHIRFKCELFGADIQVVAVQDHVNQNQFYRCLNATQNYQDMLLIEEDRPGESFRILFFQLKNQIGQTYTKFAQARKKVIQQLPSILHEHDLFQNVMTQFATLCYTEGCVLHATGVLLRAQNEVTPITEADRNAAGLSGIPLDALGDISGESLLLARVYSAGLPPLLLFRDGHVMFPTRSWYPAGLLADWQPWKQNVEFQADDLLALHAEFSGNKAELKNLHDQISKGLNNYTDVTSALLIRTQI